MFEREGEHFHFSLHTLQYRQACLHTVTSSSQEKGRVTEVYLGILSLLVDNRTREPVFPCVNLASRLSLSLSSRRKSIASPRLSPVKVLAFLSVCCCIRIDQHQPTASFTFPNKPTCVSLDVLLPHSGLLHQVSRSHDS